MGYCSSVALLATMALLTLLTTGHCNNNNNNTNISSSRASWCDGLTDPSCLIAHSDLNDLEFVMDSEISRRILAGGSGFARNAFNPGRAASCDRKGFPPCHPDSNRNRSPPRCDKSRFNRNCYHY